MEPVSSSALDARQSWRRALLFGVQRLGWSEQVESCSSCITSCNADSLRCPRDQSAYSRLANTARKLLNQQLQERMQSLPNITSIYNPTIIQPLLHPRRNRSSSSLTSLPPPPSIPIPTHDRQIRLPLKLIRQRESLEIFKRLARSPPCNLGVTAHGL